MGDYTVEQERHRADVAKLLLQVWLAVDTFVTNNKRGLDSLPRGVRNELTVEAALGYLVGNGIITLTPEEEWPRFAEFTIPEHVKPNVQEFLKELERIKGGSQ